jgi:hypothetical protein
MTAAMIINLSLGLLQMVLSNLKSGKVTSEISTAVTGIEAAITQLTAVQGTPVTFAQLESLRVEPKW